MATVTGITAVRAQQIEDASVVSGAIDGNNHLILTTAGGTQIDAGSVLGPHATDTSTHGVGEIIGATEAQNLSNKTFITPNIASFVNAQHSHDDAAGGGNLTKYLIGPTSLNAGVSTALQGPNVVCTINPNVAGVWRVEVVVKGVSSNGSRIRSKFIFTAAAGATFLSQPEVNSDVTDTGVNDGFTIACLVSVNGSSPAVRLETQYLSGTGVSNIAAGDAVMTAVKI